MELRHLRYLVAVADAGTFVRAAELLRVAQPALSRQINDLEAELKVELFEDGARKATLTDAGKAAVRIAQHVIEDTERAVRRSRMSNEGLLGECVVMCGPLPLATGLVAQLVASMRARHPAITIRIVEGAFPLVWQRIASSEVDIGLGAAPPPTFQTLAMETQFTHTVDYAVVAPEHPLASRATITLAELSNTQYLGLENNAPDIDAIRDMLEREFKRQKLRVKPPRLMATLESLLTHVRAGQGWTLMPRLFVPRIAPLVGIRIEDFQAPFQTVRCWRRADTRPVTRTVLTELRALQEEGLEESGMQREAPPAAREFVPVRLDLRHLRSFVEVAELGSMGRAAEQLDITQPALSRQMRELEFDIGVQLLERGTRGVVLTPAGQALHSDAQAVLAVVERLPAEVRRAKRGALERRCVVGVVPHPRIEAILTRVIGDLESRADRVRVGTRLLMTPQIPDTLRRGEMDVAIGFCYPARTPTPDFIARVRLFDDAMDRAVLAASHPLASRDSVSLRELQDLPFIFPNRRTFPPLYDVVMHQFELADARPRSQLEFDGLTTIWAMASQGLGWALGFREQESQPPSGTIIVPIRDFRLPWGAELSYRKDEARPAILATVDAIVATARQLFTIADPDTAPSLPALDASRAVIS